MPMLVAVHWLRARNTRVAAALRREVPSAFARTRLLVLHWTALILVVVSSGYMVLNVIVGSWMFLAQNAALAVLSAVIVRNLGAGRVSRAISTGFVPGILALVGFHVAVVAVTPQADLIIAYVPALFVVLSVSAGLVCRRRRQFRPIAAAVIASLPLLVVVRPDAFTASIPQASGIAVVVLAGVAFASVVFRLSRRAESELDLRDDLLREVHHRLRNETMILVSLIDQEEAREPNPEVQRALARQRDRIRAVLGTHDHLHLSESQASVDLDEYLGQLARPYFANRSPDEQAVEIVQEPGGVLAPVAVASPIGLILTELLANSIKHGFRGGCVQRCRVSFSVGADESGLMLRYADNGSPSDPEAAADPTGATSDALGRPAGFGLLFVERLVASFGGSLKISRDDGYRVEIRLPAADYQRKHHLKTTWSGQSGRVTAPP